MKRKYPGSGPGATPQRGGHMEWIGRHDALVREPTASGVLTLGGQSFGEEQVVGLLTGYAEEQGLTVDVVDFGPSSGPPEATICGATSAERVLGLRPTHLDLKPCSSEARSWAGGA